jgi:acetyl/propionyl-CoA carboxylase alpha subunit
VCERRGGTIVVHRGDDVLEAPIVSQGDRLVVKLRGRHVRGVVHVGGDRVVVSHAGSTWVLERTPGAGASAGRADAAGGDVEAPMTGTVLEVLCAAGDSVLAGAPLVVVEAMKMEHRLTAPMAATVSAVEVEAGRQVDIGQVLVRLDPA